MADYQYPIEAIRLGAQIGEEKLQRDYRSRLLAGQEAERMLRAQQLKQEMQITDMKLAEATQKKQLLDEGLRGLRAEMAPMFNLTPEGPAPMMIPEHLRGELGQPPARQAAAAPQVDIGQAATRHMAPYAAATGTLDDLMRAGAAKQSFTPGFSSAINPVTGQPEAIFRSSPNSANVVRPPTATVPADLRIANEITDLQDKIDTATDPAQKETLQRRLTNLQVQTAPSGMEVTTPDGTIIRQGKGVGTKIPAGTVTKAQERLSGTQKTVELLDDLQRTLRPEDVGFKGVLGDVVLDKMLPQFGISSADTARMDNRTKLKTLIEGALRQVSADSRFSNADRTAIERILPSAGMVESFESTQQTINTLRRIFAKRALIDAHEIGQEAPGFAIGALDEIALAEAVRSGLLSREKAVNEVRRRQPKP